MWTGPILWISPFAVHDAAENVEPSVEDCVFDANLLARFDIHSTLRETLRNVPSRCDQTGIQIDA